MTQTPLLLTLLIGLLSLLGAVIGCCLTLIFMKKQAYGSLYTVKKQYADDKKRFTQALVDKDQQILKFKSLQAVHNKNDGLKEAVLHQKLKAHIDMQARHIGDLKRQLVVSEEKLIKLQSDFAAYRRNKSSELNLTRQALAAGHKRAMPANTVPVLPGRPVQERPGRARPGQARPGQEFGSANGGAHSVNRPMTDTDFFETQNTLSRTKVKNHSDITATLTHNSEREQMTASLFTDDLEMPEPVESELPDTVDELDLTGAHTDSIASG